MRGSELSAAAAKAGALRCLKSARGQEVAVYSAAESPKTLLPAPILRAVVVLVAGVAPTAVAWHPGWESELGVTRRFVLASDLIATVVFFVATVAFLFSSLSGPDTGFPMIIPI